MEQLHLWITPTLVLGLFAWVRFTARDLKENMNARMSELKGDTAKRFAELKADMTNQFTEMNHRFDEVNRRFDQVNGELADNRERMA